MSDTSRKQDPEPGTLGWRINTAREKQKMKPADLAAAIGASERSVYRWENNESTPYDKTLKEIAEKTGVRQEWLETGEGDMLLPGQDNGEKELPTTVPEYVEAKGIIVCAGDGAEPEQYSKHIVPAEQYARDHATSIPANGKGDKWYVKVVGDSMAPEFFEDQWLPVELVQKPLTAVQHSGLYVVYWMDFLQLRRVARKADGSFVLLCTNPAYPNEVLEPKQAKEAIACAKVRLRERDQLIGSLMRRIVGEE